MKEKPPIVQNIKKPEPNTKIVFVDPDPKKVEEASKKFLEKFREALKILADR